LYIGEEMQRLVRKGRKERKLEKQERIEVKTRKTITNFGQNFLCLKGFEEKVDNILFFYKI